MTDARKWKPTIELTRHSTELAELERQIAAQQAEIERLKGMIDSLCGEIPEFHISKSDEDAVQQIRTHIERLTRELASEQKVSDDLQEMAAKYQADAEAAEAEVERLTRERDEWKQRYKSVEHLIGRSYDGIS